MTSRSVLITCHEALESLVNQFQLALEGIPNEDLNSWKPAAESQGGGDMNTLAAMCVHTIAAARWRTEQQLRDVPFDRDRDSEFTATATRAEIDEGFGELLAHLQELIDSGGVIDLDSLPGIIREDHPDWTRFDWLMSAVSHTALHLGHAQIHRQLWLAEQATTP